MEIYVAFLGHADEQVGHITDALKANGEFNNTLFLYVVDDNGGSGEGGIGDTINYVAAYRQMPATDAMHLPAKKPAKLAEIKALFNAKAKRNSVLPLDDRMKMKRFLASSSLILQRDHYT